MDAAKQRSDGVFARVLGADVRSLALTRMALGLIVLVDLGVRAGDLAAFYSDGGILPRGAWTRAYPGVLSLHAASGHPAFQAALFVILGVAATLFMLGWHTRVAGVVTWLLVLSAHTRNPIILQAGDSLLALLLFWCMFVPVGAAWSIDAARAAHRPRAVRVASVGTAALLLQMPCVYLFTALLKGGPEWHSSFSAIRDALRDDFIATPLGAWLGEHVPARALQSMTLGVLMLELAVPVLLLTPWRTARTRALALPVLAILQLSFSLCLRIGLFPFISTAAILAFVPTETWTALGARSAGWRARLAARFPAWAGWRQTRVSHLLARAAAPIGSARPSFRLGLGASLLCGAVLLFGLVDNISGVAGAKVVPRPVADAARALRLRQSWKMFARSSQVRRWFVLEGTLENGERIDLLTHSEGPLDGGRPDHISDTFENYRWRKYFGNVSGKREDVQRRALAQWLCRSGNEGRAPGERLARVVAWRYWEPANVAPRAVEAERARMFTKECQPRPGPRRSPLATR